MIFSKEKLKHIEIINVWVNVTAAPEERDVPKDLISKIQVRHIFIHTSQL